MARKPKAATASAAPIVHAIDARDVLMTQTKKMADFTCSTLQEAYERKLPIQIAVGFIGIEIGSYGYLRHFRANGPPDECPSRLAVQAGMILGAANFVEWQNNLPQTDEF